MPITYQTRTSSFITFCHANQLNWVDAASLDVCVCEFFDQMFLSGYGGEEGSKYLAALASYPTSREWAPFRFHVLPERLEVGPNLPPDTNVCLCPGCSYVQ